MARKLLKRERRRSGFILVTALMIVLLGAALSVGIFALAQAMFGTDILNRHVYEEQINMTSLIEEAKAFIIFENQRRISSDVHVLHGQGGTSDDYFPINRLSDLQVCSPQSIADVLSREITLSGDRGFRRHLTLQVYDANYRVDDVRFTPGPDMPPSLYPTRIIVHNEIGESYAPDTSPPPDSNDVQDRDLYKVFGAYLIRVELHREGLQKPQRRTEEMFFELASNDTVPIAGM